MLWVNQFKEHYMHSSNSFKKKLFISITIISSLFILFYWATVFAGLFPVKDIVPGYTNWFMAFPAPDFWLAILLAVTSVLYLKDSEHTGKAGIAAGSSMIFLGLYALSYGFTSGTIFNINTDTIIEICIKVYCLTVGPALMIHFWKMKGTK